MIIRRLMVSAALVGATLLAGAAPFAAAQHTGAGKTVTVKGDGFSIQFPVTWQYDAKFPLTKLFHKAALQKLASTAVVGVTADGIDDIAVFTQHASLTKAAVQKIEASMFTDGTGKVVKAPIYTTASHGVVTGTMYITVPYKGKSQKFGLVISAESGGGATLYALVSIATGYAADSQQVTAALATLH